MSTEDEYTAHRRRLREEHGLPPVDDSEEVEIIELPGGRGFLSNAGVWMITIGDPGPIEAGLPDSEWALWTGAGPDPAA